MLVKVDSVSSSGQILPIYSQISNILHIQKIFILTRIFRQCVPRLRWCIPILARMITRSVTIEDIDDLYLMWNDHINASALYRRALRKEMEVRDVDPDDLRDLLERAREQGYTKEEIVDETNRYADLKALVEDAEE